MISLLPFLLMAFNPAADMRVADWQARAQTHEAANEWCAALFYRKHTLAVATDDVTRYHAFLDAYAADQLRTAHALASELRVDALGLDDDAARKVAVILDDLESLATLDDAPCAHASVCGDGIVEGNEMCDGRDASCTSQCEHVVVPPRVAVTAEQPKRVVEAPAPPTASPVKRDAHEALIIAGAVASAAGLLSVGTGAFIAFESDQRIADPLSLGSSKADAVAARSGGWWAMGIGSVVAIAGAAAFGVGRAEANEVVDGSDEVVALHDGRRR